MNEKIKELGRECWVLGPIGYHFDKQLFATKIILECAELMYGRDEDGNCKDGDVIKQHFGVKE